MWLIRLGAPDASGANAFGNCETLVANLKILAASQLLPRPVAEKKDEVGGFRVKMKDG